MQRRLTGETKESATRHNHSYSRDTPLPVDRGRAHVPAISVGMDAPGKFQNNSVSVSLRGAHVEDNDILEENLHRCGR